MGREESKEQAKAAQREKEEAAHAKKQANRDRQWEKGAKDTSKDDAAAAKAAADQVSPSSTWEVSCDQAVWQADKAFKPISLCEQAKKDAVKAQLAAEGGGGSTSVAQPPATKKCKECGHKMTPKEQKKGCPKCIEIMLGGGAPGKGKGKK